MCDDCAEPQLGGRSHSGSTAWQDPLQQLPADQERSWSQNTWLPTEEEEEGDEDIAKGFKMLSLFAGSHVANLSG